MKRSITVTTLPLPNSTSYPPLKVQRYSRVEGACKNASYYWNET